MAEFQVKVLEHVHGVTSVLVFWFMTKMILTGKNDKNKQKSVKVVFSVWGYVGCGCILFGYIYQYSSRSHWLNYMNLQLYYQHIKIQSVSIEAHQLLRFFPEKQA